MEFTLSDLIYLCFKIMHLAHPEQNHCVLSVKAAAIYVGEVDEMFQNSLFYASEDETFSQIAKLSSDFHFFEMDETLFVLPKSDNTYTQIDNYEIPGDEKFLDTLLNENALSCLGVSQNTALNAQNNQNLLSTKQKTKLIEQLTEVLIDDNFHISETSLKLAQAESTAHFTNKLLLNLAESGKPLSSDSIRQK